MTTVDLAIPAPPIVAVPIDGADQLFPVRRIYCIGRNYGKHVKEMGGDPREQPPIFFMKPADAATPDGGEVPYPPGTNNLHHEVELVIALKSGGSDIDAAKALDHVFGYAVGVDLTRRDLQNEAKDRGQPWDASKGFDASAPLGPIRPVDRRSSLVGAIRLTVNGAVRQDGRLEDMIWDPAAIIAAVSRLWRLEPGDLIFTGTPDGVGPLVRGDLVEGEIEGVGRVRFRIG